jgi:hypothetical protein
MSSLPTEQAAPAPKKSRKIWIIVVIALVILCCLCVVLIFAGFAGFKLFQGSSTGFGDMLGIIPPGSESIQEATTEPLNESTQSSPDLEKTPQGPIVQIPNLFGVELGDVVRCEPCGFSFKKVPGYEYTKDWDVIITMLAPGADEKIGPIIMLIGGVPNEGLTLDGLMKAMKDTGLNYSNEKNIKVDGVSAVSFDAEDTIDGVAIKGRSVGALVTPNQIFTITAFAPADKWEELRPYFEAVLNSVSFFEPVPVPTETVQP